MAVGLSSTEALARDYILRRCEDYLGHRYSESLLNEARVKMKVDVSYEPHNMSYAVKLHTYNGFYLALRVLEDGIMEINGPNDWLMYHLQRIEPMIDTLVFMEWFYHQLSDVDKAVFKTKIYTAVKAVGFVPPRGVLADGKIHSGFLVKIMFENGQIWREIMHKIGEESDQFLAMLLMVQR